MAVSRRWTSIAIALASAALLAACGGNDTDDVSPATPDGAAIDGSADADSGALSMGSDGLGDNSETRLLAQYQLRERPAVPVVWVAHEVRLAAGGSIEHGHELAFVYGVEGESALETEDAREVIAPGAGAAVPAGATHVHEAGAEGATFWEMRLAPPGAPLPGGYGAARLVFESEQVSGIPESPRAVFVSVVLPPGGETIVHTHPGPEFIYQLSGRIDYQNADKLIEGLARGGAEGIAAEVAVQKRNPFMGSAEFLSWFLVDPERPFATAARFDADGSRGPNLALLANGARVSGASSNFGGGSDSSMFGATRAIDGDIRTEWSSDGDGTAAWIEIELPQRTHVHGLGFWTRTMGASAEIQSFRVITDSGEIFGPFQLSGPDAIQYVDTDFVAIRLRFEAVETTGGNTGVIEIEVYGEPEG